MGHFTGGGGHERRFCNFIGVAKIQLTRLVAIVKIETLLACFLSFWVFLCQGMQSKNNQATHFNQRL